MLGIGIGIQYNRGVSNSRLLDSYANVAAVYSLRKLRTSYTGNSIRVRRSSDNTEQDIGFSNNILDTTSLLSFVGSNDGFVTTWYDQSGGGYNQTNTTATKQPSIVTSGTVNSSDGNPALKFTFSGGEYLFTSITGLDSASDFLLSSVFEFLQGNQSWDMIAGFRSAPMILTSGAAILQGISTVNEIGIHDTDVSTTSINVDVTTRLGQKLASVGRTGGTNGNGGSVTIASTGHSQASYSTTANQTWSSNSTNGFQIGGRQQSGTSYGDKYISEIICFSANLTTLKRQDMENNQGNFYGITI